MEPLTLASFPRAILHIDGDAFFASCEQSRRPTLQGRPVVTGKERGIAASMSYEAKARGVTRGMRLAEIRKICPDAVILPSDYETYSLLSKRFFAIVRRYTPDMEEYNIDECFADLTGLRRPLRMPYLKIAERMKKELDTELGFTFSVGLAPNKVVAKIASKWQKPSGLTAIPGLELHRFLAKLPVEGCNEMDPLLCGSTAMSHNAFQSRAPMEPQEARPLKHEMHGLGIAIAKRVFHAVGMDGRGNVVYRKRLSRHDLMPCSAKLPPVRIGMEACGGAHDWARRFREHGPEVTLMASQCVKPYRDPFPRIPHDTGPGAVYTCPGPRERRDPAGVIFCAPDHCTRS